MVEHGSTYVDQVASRIVRMFELYAQTVNPDEERFKAFISHYLAEKGVNNPETMRYSELYRLIKDGVREYLKQQQTKAGAGK